jgi:hypothetical protein
MKYLFRITLLAAFLLAGIGIAGDARAQDDGPTFFRTEDGSYSVFLPEGWVAEGSAEDGLVIANSQEAFVAFEADDDPQPGQLVVVVSAIDTPTADLLEALDLEAETSLVDLLDTVGPLLFSGDGGFSVGPADAISFAGRNAALAEVGREGIEGAVILYMMGPDRFGIGFIAGAPGILDEAGEQASEVLGLVRYSLTLDKTHESEGFTLSYPDGWVVDESEGFTLMSNDAAAIDADELAEGQYGIVVVEAAALGSVSKDVTKVAAEVGELLADEGDVLSDVFTLEVDGRSVASIDVTNANDDTNNNEGGLFVTDTDQGIFAVIYFTAAEDSYQLGLTALNVLLGVQ